MDSQIGVPHLLCITWIRSHPQIPYQIHSSNALKQSILGSTSWAKEKSKHIQNIYRLLHSGYKCERQRKVVKESQEDFGVVIGIYIFETASKRDLWRSRYLGSPAYPRQSPTFILHPFSLMQSDLFFSLFLNHQKRPTGFFQCWEYPWPRLEQLLYHEQCSAIISR